MKISGIILFGILIFTTVTAHSARYSCSEVDVRNNNCFDLIKLNSAAALGTCLPQGSPADVSAMLSRNNVTGNTGAIPRDLRPRRQNDLTATRVTPFSDLTDPRMVALTRVVNAFDKIGNGSMSALRSGSRIDVIFEGRGTTSGNSRKHGNQIQLVGGTQNMTGTMGHSTCEGVDNIGLIAHEIGHYIGGHNNRENYKAYEDAMALGRCRLSQYSIDKAGDGVGEEFAEVVAAYITYPDAFVGKGANCRRAFEFMKNLFGEPDMTMSCDARRRSYRVNAPRSAYEEAELIRNIPLMPSTTRLRFAPGYYRARPNRDFLIPTSSDQEQAID